MVNFMITDDRQLRLARTNGGPAAIREQVRALTRFANDNHIRVVGKMTLPHCADVEYKVEEHLTVLLGRRRGRDGFDMIIITDLSHFSRCSPPHSMALLKRLATAGVAVVTPHLDAINE